MIRLFNLFLALIFSFTLTGEASNYWGDHLVKKIFAEDIEIDISEQENADEDSVLTKASASNGFSNKPILTNYQVELSNPVTILPLKGKYSLYLLYCTLKLDC